MGGRLSAIRVSVYRGPFTERSIRQTLSSALCENKTLKLSELRVDSRQAFVLGPTVDPHSTPSIHWTRYNQSSPGFDKLL